MSDNRLKSGRVAYYDFLRIFAIYAVVVIHVCSQMWYDMEINSYAWIVQSVYNGLSRWAVPVFVMISGSLFLSREKLDIKKLYSKNIVRLVTALVFWSLFYAFSRYILVEHSLREMFKNAAMGAYHLWFIKMLIGIYILLPLIRKLAEDEKILKYSLAVIFIFSSCFKQLVEILPFSAHFKAVAFGDFQGVVSLSVYIGYFLLGYYLSKIQLEKRARVLLYISGVISAAAVAAVTVLVSVNNNEVYKDFIDYSNIFVAVSAAAVFELFKNIKAFDTMSGRKREVLSRLSQYTFGAYLIRVAVMTALDKGIGFNAQSYNPLISVPVNSLIVFAISMLASFVLNQIPVVKKYLV